MKRSSSPENDDGPVRKRLTKKEVRRILEFYDLAHTCGTVIWSGTVEIPDSQKIVFDCSIKVLHQDEVINSLLPQKQLTIHSIPFSTFKSLYPYKMPVQPSGLILCTDENTDMMSYSAFSQAIRRGSDMLGCTVLKKSASYLHLLFVYSSSSGHGDYILGVIATCQANDTVLGILRSHGLLPCVNPEHEELVKQITRLKEELQYKDKKLTEQQKLNQELVERHKNEMEEKERKHEEERNRMEEQITEKERKITTLDRKMKDVLHGKEEILTNLYYEFQCSICQDTIIEAYCLPSCRHMFCKFCIGQWLKEETKCPLCKLQAGIPVPCIAFDRAVDNFIDHFGNEAKQQRMKSVKDREEVVRATEERGSSQYEALVVRMRGLDASSEGVVGERLRREPVDARVASWLATLPPEIPLSSPSSSSSYDEPTVSRGNQM